MSVGKKFEFCNKFLDLTLKFCIFFRHQIGMSCHSASGETSNFTPCYIYFGLGAIAGGDSDCQGTSDAWNTDYCASWPCHAFCVVDSLLGTSKFGWYHQKTGGWTLPVTLVTPQLSRGEHFQRVLRVLFIFFLFGFFTSSWEDWLSLAHLESVWLNGKESHLFIVFYPCLRPLDNSPPGAGEEAEKLL